MNYFHFVGIDVSKLTFDASILDCEENELAHRKFKNSSSGIQEMVDWAMSFQADISSNSRQTSAAYCFAPRTWDVMCISYPWPV